MAKTYTIDQLITKFRDLDDQVAGMDLSPVLTECAQLIELGIKNNFDQERTPDGQPWTARKDDFNHQTLNKTGRLKSSASSPGGEHIRNVTPQSLEVGTSNPYAGFQNDGTKSIPPREFMGTSDQVAEECGNKILDFIVENLDI